MIKINNLKKRFDSHEVLKAIDISIDKGKIYGLVGSNGCGKTILATNLSCNRKLIEHDKTGYIVDKTTDSLCEGLKKMSENINFRVQLENNVKSNIAGQMNLDDNELFAFVSSVCD